MSAVTSPSQAHDASLWQPDDAPPDPFLLAADIFDPPRADGDDDRERCAADPAEFIERLEIENPDGTVIPLTLWPFQRDSITTINQHAGVIVLKARRLGLSWIVLAYALWLAIFQQGVRILILCKKEDDASELLDRIRRMFNRLARGPNAHLLAGLAPTDGRGRDAVTTLNVGASTLKALVGTPAAARSETAGFVILDEFAFQKGASDIWRGVLPTIEGGGKIAVVSTGNGAPRTASIGAEFAEQWTRANAGDSDFAALFFPWQMRPDRDEEWKRRTLSQLGDPDRFKTEYPETPDEAFTSPDTIYVFNSSAIDAAIRLGREYDELLRQGRMPAPTGERLAAGVDWGDFRSHAVPVWELERGGIYLPPGEVATTQQDPEDIALEILASLAQYDHWFGEQRYDASFKQTNRTFARVAEKALGPHNAIRRTGRPNTVPVAFGTYKSLCVGYVRLLLRRTLAGETTRVLAISPTNTTLLEQMRAYEQNELGRFEKGNDDAVDALLAGVQPVAKRHREFVEAIDA